jgi:23S rRNA pseudouridine2605 synthase
MVLLTAAVAHRLLHPSLGNEREYRVQVQGRVASEAFRRLERGILLDDGRTAPARVACVRHDSRATGTRFDLVLTEGRKRQIRRSLAALGHPVISLLRTRMGTLRLGRLARGAARPLAAGELRALRRHAESLAAVREDGHGRMITSVPVETRRKAMSRSIGRIGS